MRAACRYRTGKLALTKREMPPPAVQLPTMQALSQWPQVFPVPRSPLAQRNSLPVASALPMPAPVHVDGYPTAMINPVGTKAVLTGSYVPPAPAVVRATPVVLSARLA